MLKLIVFDFDGTLVDTFEDCVDAFNQALTDNGFPARDPKDYRHVFGQALPVIMKEVLPEDHRDPETVEKVCQRYKEVYAASEKARSLPYPGIRGMLDILSRLNVKLAIQSNKDQKLLDDITGKLFGDNVFDAVQGFSETRAPKPDPAGLYELMDQFGATKEQTVYVGDGMNDIMTAHNAGIPIIAVVWGQGRTADILDPSVEYLAPTRRALKKIIYKLMDFNV